jgi:plastocyanin
MPDWLIEIIPVNSTDPDGPAEFQPAIQEVLAGDNITWTNRTGIEHQPVPVTPTPPSWAASFGVNPIPAEQSSNPTYSVVAPVEIDPNTGQPVLVDGATVPVYGLATYRCQKHENEIAKFDILKVPKF